MTKNATYIRIRNRKKTKSQNRNGKRKLRAKQAVVGGSLSMNIKGTIKRSMSRLQHRIGPLTRSEDSCSAYLFPSSHRCTREAKLRGINIRKNITASEISELSLKKSAWICFESFSSERADVYISVNAVQHCSRTSFEGTRGLVGWILAASLPAPPSLSTPPRILKGLPVLSPPFSGLVPGSVPGSFPGTFLRTESGMSPSPVAVAGLVECCRPVSGK